MHQPPIIWLPDNFRGPFPSPELATIDPDGLLAAGGNLRINTLLQAYRQGIFPWYSYDQPILWWSPNPRCVVFPDKLHISRSLQRTINKQTFEIRLDTAFREVMLACAAPRDQPASDIFNSAQPRMPDEIDTSSTWITPAMLEAYCELHHLGHARSVECWQNNQLVGGIYGVHLGKVFFGESMFSHVRDASKVALRAVFDQLRPALLDAQVHSSHLESLGAEMIQRDRFLQLLDQYC